MPVCLKTGRQADLPGAYAGGFQLFRCRWMLRLPMLYVNAGGQGVLPDRVYAGAVQRDRRESGDCADAAGEDRAAGGSLGAGAVGAGNGRGIISIWFWR